MKTHARRLCLEVLEARDVPALFGIPWMDAQHLTLSFVPDGTPVDGVVSTLDQDLSKNITSQAAYRTEILRAFQQWIAPANINLALVADSGAEVGVSGATQHDARFGDIRVAAHWLSYDALAITSPPGALAGTRTGDVILNDKFTFGLVGSSSVKELYSVMLQEAGHALGMHNSADTTSVMYEKYTAGRTGLSTADVAQATSLYGVRQNDVFEGTGNDTFATAKALALPTGSVANSTLVAKADLTRATDVDYYTYKATSANNLTFRLNASKFSLLAGKLSVYDANKNLVRSASATGPGGDLSVTLTGVKSGATYYVKVEQAAGTPFSVGAYELEIANTTGGARVNAVGSLAPVNDNSTNDTRGTATTLTARAGYAANTHYETFAQFRTGSDKDYYKFRSASVTVGTPNVMTLSTWATNGSVAPTMTVYDANGVLVPTTILDVGKGTTTLQFAAAESAKDYYVALVRPSGASDQYRVAIDFRTVETTLKVEQQGTLTQAAKEVWKNLWVGTTDLRYFTLSATSQTGQPSVGLQMTIYGIRGEIVGQLTARAGETVSTAILLNSGLYWMRITGATGDNSSLLSLSYVLSSRSLSDPISVLPIDTTTGTSTPPPEPTLSWSAGSGYSWLINLYPPSNAFLTA